MRDPGESVSLKFRTPFMRAQNFGRHPKRGPGGHRVEKCGVWCGRSGRKTSRGLRLLSRNPDFSLESRDVTGEFSETFTAHPVVLLTTAGQGRGCTILRSPALTHVRHLARSDAAANAARNP